MKAKQFVDNASFAPSDLLSAIVRYIIPEVEQKSQQISSPLEDLAQHQGTTPKKTKHNPLREIQKSIDSIVNGIDPGVVSIKTEHILEHGLSYTLHKKTSLHKKYSMEVKYHGNAAEEKINVRLTVEEDEETETTIVSKSSKKEKKHYEFTLVKPREVPLERNYALDISYRYRMGEETAHITYVPSKPYIQKHIESKNDATEKVPLKPIHHMWPESIMGGVLGFTYIGENFMGRRDDLVGWWARMVDIHESIHTPDEYETRVLTDHIMDKTPPKYPMIPSFILPKAEYKHKH